MFELPKVFHVSHVVDDLDVAMKWYDDLFSPRVWQHTELWGTSLALLVVGDVVMMPMQPALDPPSSPGKFKMRFGQRLHSLALYVDEPVPMIEHLRAQGLYLTGSRGTALDNPQDEIWTQPRETPMVFELFQPRESMNDPRLNEPDWSSAYWRDEHPLGIQGSVFTNVTGDRAKATAFYVDALRGTVLREGVATPYGTTSNFVRLSDEVTMEVAQPTGTDSRAAADLEVGGTFHAVTFRVADLDRAAAHVESKGVRTERPAPGHVVLDPADSFGVLIRLTDRDLADW